MARIRSPNYPAISLAEAIKRIGQVHAKERQHFASRNVILKGMGYSGVNGVSLGVLSAVLKYGLLEQQGRGEDYRVTDRAVAILHPHDPAEKVAAINEAAKAPPLFAELLDHFKGDLPSDDNLRVYLVRRGFSQTSLPNVIQAFRDTLEIASLEDLAYSAPDTAVIKERHVAPHAAASSSAKSTVSGSTTPIATPMSVLFDGNQIEITAVLSDVESVDRLIRALEANTPLLPAKVLLKENDAGK
jgi:hypothetical protein